MQRSSPNTRMNSVKRSRSPTPTIPTRHSPDVGSSGSKRIKAENTTPAPTDHLANLRLSKNSEGSANAPVKLSQIPAGGRPQLAAYHPTFGQIEAKIGAMCLNFGRRFTEIKMLGNTGDALDDTADEISRYTNPTDHYRPIKPIPLVGSMNVGKSLLATCLMDEVGAAIISALDRGTSTITEYHYLLPRQATRFEIQLIFYTRDQIAALVEAFSQQVFEFLRLDHMRVEDPDEVDHDAWVDSQNQCNAALEILSGILQECNVSALAEKEGLRTWFCDQASESASQTDASQYLITEVHTALDRRQNEGRPEIYPANTTKELLDILASCSRNFLIARIQLHLNSDLAEQGIILADTPGLGDSNPIIVDATKRYLHGAERIIDVAQLGRWKESKDVESQLRTMIAMRRQNDSVLVFTGIDKIDRLRPEDHPNTNEKRELQYLEGRTDDLEARYAQLCDMEEDLTEDDDTLYAKFMKEKKACEQELKAAQSRQHELFVAIHTRTEETIARPRWRQLEMSNSAPDLATFFTSAKDYELQTSSRGKRRAQESSTPILSIECSGVPKVRNMLYAIPAELKYETLSHLVIDELPRLFRAIDALCSKSPLERYNEVSTRLMQVLKWNAEAAVRKLREQLITAYRTHVASTFDAHKQSTWPNASHGVVLRMENLHTRTMTAFCDKFGFWKWSKGKDIGSVNHEILQIPLEDTREAFESFMDEASMTLDSFEAELETNVFGSVQTVLDSKDFHQASKSAAFQADIDSVKKTLLRDLRVYRKELKNSIRHIYIDAAVNDGQVELDTSYVAIYMQDCYEDARKISSKKYPKASAKLGRGNGAHAARVDIFRKALTSSDEGNVYTSIGDQADEAWESTLSTWCAKLDKRFAKARRDIQRPFDNRYKPKGKDQQHDPAIAHDLSELTKDALEELNTAHEMLKECKRWEEEGDMGSANREDSQ